MSAEITVRIVDADEGLALNLQFRGQDHATNVLTFPYPDAPVLSADLVLCAPVVEAEAAAQGVAPAAHYAHLIVHGTLHAQGFDHERRTDAAMEARESGVLAASASRSVTAAPAARARGRRRRRRDGHIRGDRDHDEG